LSVRTAEGASEKQSSLKARQRNGLTYLLTYLLTYKEPYILVLEKLLIKETSIPKMEVDLCCRFR